MNKQEEYFVWHKFKNSCYFSRNKHISCRSAKFVIIFEVCNTEFTEYLLPISCVERCDLVFSTAGSCSVGVMAGVPTVRIYQLTNVPEGFITRLKSREYMVCPNGNTVYDYICMFCQGKNIPKLEKYDLTQNWTDAIGYFNRHIDFLKNSVQAKEYFDFSLIPLSLRERCQIFSMSWLGMNIYSKIWRD